MKKIAKIAMVLLLSVAVMTGCGSSLAQMDNTNEGTTEEKKLITVGFSQLGAESDWRSANTVSMQSAFVPEEGYNLIYKNGQQKQANQITAIRTFIQQEVDYIVLAPVTESGWDTVLGEARDAGIPVILVDRRVDVPDKTLYSCWVGSDFELEGRKMAAWIKSYAQSIGMDADELHIVNIQGTIGSTAQIGRTRGLANAARENGWDLMAEVSGDFTETKGREVMAGLLKRFDNINVVYCENDNEAIGAIDAIEAAGKKVGSNLRKGEIMVVSFDGVNKEALDYAKEGKISCIAECNPLHGPRVKALVDMLVAGETPDKFNYVDERLFSSIPDVTEVEVDGVSYAVQSIDN
ncbi:MAG: ABC transporter substrate-binding protein [Butyrivibrio sp.]|uniref:ABC transporter substrate-binding protein n=1 Tax=Butyrivibrio sp. TaxID=28121 RepID=UPI0025BF78BC|nr:ABC transporter substrate-binding protein [Butyrivibrio sp.]MBQ6589820.1 ABC transporter substrate-binding protein [Butyrivibrio sp.]